MERPTAAINTWVRYGDTDDDQGSGHVFNYIDYLEAEIARMRPVVEAAVALRDEWHRIGAGDVPGVRADFYNAVDAYAPKPKSAEEVVADVIDAIFTNNKAMAEQTKQKLANALREEFGDFDKRAEQ